MQADRTFVGHFSRQEKAIHTQPHRLRLCMILGALCPFSRMDIDCGQVHSEVPHLTAVSFLTLRLPRAFILGQIRVSLLRSIHK